jgi:hypothetical protein
MKGVGKSRKIINGKTVKHWEEEIPRKSWKK